MSDKAFKPFTQNDYLVMKREVVYEGIFRIATYSLRYHLFNGGMSKPVSREIFERSAAVAVLPYDPRTDSVILIEQFRAGAIANPQSPWLLEIVAGSISETEQPLDVARRELKEEAGCEALDLYPICEYFVSPGGCNEYLSLFCGHVDAKKAGGVFGLQEEDEDIRSFVVTADDAFIMLQEGKIKTSPAIVALQWLQLNREWLKQLWLKS